MPHPICQFARHRRFASVAFAAVTVLLTAAATWLWAHEGHVALPTAGVTVDAATGLVALSATTRAAADVRVADVRLQVLDECLTAPATVVAPWQGHAYVTARLGGKVAAVHVQPGQVVVRGQTLVEIESLELENLQLDLLDAHNQAERSSRDVAKLRDAFQSGALPARDLADAEARHQQHLDALEIAQLKLLGLGLPEDAVRQSRPVRTLPVRSPLSGVAVHVDAGVGQVVEPAEHLLEVVDGSRLWVKIAVLERDLHRVKAGQPVTVRLAALPAQTFAGTVAITSLSLDPQTHQGAAWVDLDNPDGRLLPGMFGSAELRLAAKAGLVLPATGLIVDGAEQYVLVEHGPGQYRRQNVVVEGRVDSLVCVARDVGLFPGDRVVTAGSHELSSFFVQGVLRLSPEAERSIGLRVEPAGLHPIGAIVQLDGMVDLPPNRKAIVAARLAGTVERILVDRDQVVQAGDVVAEIASLELQTMQLDLLRSHLQARLLGPRVAVLRELAKAGALSDRTLRDTEADLVTATQRRDSLHRKLRAAGASEMQLQALLQKREILAALPVRATVGGAVVRLRVVLGQAVKAEEPLFEVHDLAGATLRGFVAEADVVKVRIGQHGRVRLVADPSFADEFVIERSAQTLATDDRSLSVWATLRTPPPAPLLHGMLARMSVVVSESAPVLAVPPGAVWREGTDAYLFLRRADGCFERRAVRTKPQRRSLR